MIPLLLLTLTAAPPTLDLTDHVDIIELNHYHDSRGCRILSQWIFWEWRAEFNAYRVVAWRMANVTHSLTSSPRVSLRWRDGEICRRVVANECRETWTLFDPEVRDREFLWREGRRGLSRNIQPPLAVP